MPLSIYAALGGLPICRSFFLFAYKFPEAFGVLLFLPPSLPALAALGDGSQTAEVGIDLSRVALREQQKAELLEAIASQMDDGIMNFEDFYIGRSLGAKAKNYEVTLPDGTTTHFTEGTWLQGSETIAGKGRNRQIDNIDNLLRDNGGDPLEWQKEKGYGYIDFHGESYKAEIHWYEEPNAGKHEFKVRSYNGGWIIYED